MFFFYQFRNQFVVQWNAYLAKAKGQLLYPRIQYHRHQIMKINYTHDFCKKLNDSFIHDFLMITLRISEIVVK